LDPGKANSAGVNVAPGGAAVTSGASVWGLASRPDELDDGDLTPFDIWTNSLWVSPAPRPPTLATIQKT
jgi:hypothetical protein